MCQTLEISLRTYYRNRNTLNKDDVDAQLIFEVFNKSHKTYGYRRIQKALLLKYGLIMNHKKVLRIMNKYHIMPTYSKRTRRNNGRRKFEENVRPNLLKRNFNVSEPNKVWVTDITEFHVEGQVLYISTILDLYDRSIVSMQYRNANTLLLVMDTLKWAKLYRIDAKNLIIHSDQGFQYTSYEYQTACRNYGYQISMSRKGTPLDNAVIESFHSRMKTETIWNEEIKTMKELKEKLFDWFYRYDNERIRGK